MRARNLKSQKQGQTRVKALVHIPKVSLCNYLSVDLTKVTGKITLGHMHSG